MTRIVAYCMLLLLPCFWAKAQSGEAGQWPEEMKVRTFDRDHWRKLIAPLDYDGGRLKETRERNSSGQREVTSDKMPSAVQERKWYEGAWMDNPILKILSRLFLILAGAAILFFLIKALLQSPVYRPGRSNSKTSKEGKEGEINMVEVEDDPDNFDLPELIKRAEQSGKFDVAVRLHFLQILKVLSSGKLIVRKKGKANHEYLAELRGTGLYGPMQDLTALFERVYYGEYPMTAMSYPSARARFLEVREMAEEEGIPKTDIP